MPAPNSIYAWMDLGAEGLIPNPANWAAGTGGASTVSSTATDLEMPNKDGFELIADVHGALSTEDLPVIAITGHDELHGRVGQIEGVYGIFKKPWNDRELLKRVDSLRHLRTAASRRGRRATDLRAG